MTTSKKTILLIALVLLILPSITYAVSWWPLVPCGTSANPTPCNQCDLLKLLKNIIDFVLMGLMPPAAAILFVWGGFLILMGGANPGLISKGKDIFWNTAIGVAILLASWLITNTIIRSVAADNVAPEWWKFECRVTTVPQVSPGEQPSVFQPQPPESYPKRSPGQPPASQPEPDQQPVPPSSGAICLYTGKNLCQPKQMTCTARDCSSYNQTIQKYAGGAASVNLLKAIMVKESSCNALADSGHAYGLMQLIPATANIYKNRCGVSTNITPQWLKDNPSLSICIAAEYLKVISQTQCGVSVRNIAAGYNGGEKGACNPSVDCTNEKSCDGSAVKRWECLYDDTQHNVCNTGYDETRDYAAKVLYCYNNPGF